MIMKKIFFSKITAVFAVMFLLSACADLDLPSDGRLTYKDLFSHYTMTRSYYQSCRAYIPQYGLQYHNSTPLASYCDEAHDTDDTRSGTAVNAWYNNRTSPFDNPLVYTYGWWDGMFQGIRKCNTFLAFINDPEVATAEISDAEKDGWIAEVRVARAFYYLQLIKRYGGVPIMDEPYEVDHDFSKNRRPTFEECVDFILADCDAALATTEPTSTAIGFRWIILDQDRGRLTRGFAYAIKSQAALYAASPLWYTPGSKYTWEYVAAITKEALDQCLINGKYELYNLPVDADVAQNPYAYYFIQRADLSRSVDKETIFETTAARTNVWRYAGTPITDGMDKAGAGPTQELVDCYEMQATGEMPILGYSDADHLQPVINPAAGYNPANPYEGRDPRFYASIYYNNAPRSLTGSGPIEKDLYPVDFLAAGNNITITREDGFVTLKSSHNDPNIRMTQLTRPLSNGAVRQIAFEYKSNRAVTNAEFFYCVRGNPVGGLSSGANVSIPQAEDWTWFEFDLSLAINNWGFGVNDSEGFDPATHFLRFDPTANADYYEISIRNFRIEVFTPPPPPTPVETFVGGNCEISDRVTDTRFTRTGYYIRKFNNYRSDINVDADGLMKIFRLGELYMNFAEAAYQAYGPDAPVAGGMSARDAVNAIRVRAEMPPLPAGMNKTDFEKRYRNERRVEFAFEEHRFFDVRRWKILNETDKFVTGMRITKTGNDYTYTRFRFPDRNTHSDKYLMFPIKQAEVTKMEEITGEIWQNPGW